MGRNNLNLNTSKFFGLIGIEKDKEGENMENEEELQSPRKNKKN